MSFRQQFLRQSKNLSLKYIPSRKTLILGGPMGDFFYFISHKLKYSSANKKFWLDSKRKVANKSSFFLSQILLNQSCVGVVLGYRCQLNLVGIGYTAWVEKVDNTDVLVLKIGFSHLVKITLPNFLSVSCPRPRTILIKGINLQKVTNFASLIKGLKLPNPYKEKGLYFVNETFKLKQGKKT